MSIPSTKSTSFINFLQNVDLRNYAIIVSVIFSCFAIIKTPLLHDDAFIYLQVAEVYLNDGIAAALDSYSWAGYSIVIALISKYFPISILNSAYLLNTITYAILVYSFITLVTEHKKTLQLKIFATLVILVFPHINEMRSFIIRDIGYWAFCITALLQLIRFNRHHKIINAFGWCFALLAAIFFRLEGLLLLLFTPLAILLTGTSSLFQRITKTFTLYFILLSLSTLVFFLALLKGVDIIELSQSAYQYYLPRLNSFFSGIAEKTNHLSQAIFYQEFFPGHSVHSYVILSVSYIYIIIINAINSFSVPFTIIFCYGFIKNKFRVSPEHSIPAIFFALVSACSLLTFIFIMQFITGRYSILLSLILLSFIPLCLDSMYNTAKAEGKTKRFKFIFGALAILFLVDSFISFGYSKQYISDSISWTQSNLNPDSQLITNHHAIAYFSHLIEDYVNINTDISNIFDSLTSGDYLALEIGYREQEIIDRLEQQQGLDLLVEFSNNRNDQVKIYYFSP